MSKIYDSLMKVEKERQGESKDRLISRIFEPDKTKMEQHNVMVPPREKIDKLKLVTGSGEKRYSEEKSSRSQSRFFVMLADSIRTNLNVLKMLSELSHGKFKDVEFEKNFIKTINEYIHGTNSGLDCFFDYLKIKSPVRRENMVHAVFEEILEGNQKKLKDRNIQVVKKDFEKDLPETSIREDHLRYILNWVVQYAISSVSSNGSIGLFTRPFDYQEVKGNSQSFLKKDRRYIEVIIFFTTDEKVNRPSGTGLGDQALIRENQKDFILPLVEEIINVNGGIIRVKVDHKKHWTQLLLILPAQ